GRWRSVREKGIMKLILSIIFRQNFLLHHKLLITRNENFRKPIFFSFLFFFSSFWFYVSKVENKLCARFLYFYEEFSLFTPQESQRFRFHAYVTLVKHVATRP
ncbi:MAG: hypothetical protein J6581_10130, partial [Apibacter sp.]|nr:hypothetical protein [Apibacter sp.]